MTTIGASVDPTLSQHLLAVTGSTEAPPPEDAHAGDTVPVVARLDPEDAEVPGLATISRFGGVVTARVHLADVDRVRRHPAVRNLKRARTYGPTLEPPVSDLSDLSDIDGTAAQLPAASGGRGGPLTGRGTLVAVLDWGLDVTHANLRDADGRTAVEALWDQRGGPSATSPAPFGYGRVIDTAMIDAALATADPHVTLGYDHTDVDPGRQGTHGTHVADILLGRGRAPGASPGVAPGARLVFVHLRGEDTAPEDSLGDSTRILEAVDFAVRRAAGRPLVVHMSLGRTGGPHDDSLLVVRALDHLLTHRSGVAVVMSCGNYHDSRMHAALRLSTHTTVELPWDVPSPPPEGSELEIWYAGGDRVTATLVDPSGHEVLSLPPGTLDIDRPDAAAGAAAVVSGFHRVGDPNNAANQIDLFLRPGAPTGTWRVRLTGQTVRDGSAHAWIERTAPAHQSRFPASVAGPDHTIGSLAGGRLPLAVGAYSSTHPEHAPTSFSSVGPTRDGRSKPDIAAPGHQVLAARSSILDATGHRQRDGLTRKSGTSMAAPFVSGTVALLFEAVGARRLPMAVTRWLVMEGARPPEHWPERYGAGRLDVAASCRLALALAPTTALPSHSTGRSPGSSTSHESGPERSENGAVMTMAPTPTSTPERVLAWLGEGVVDPLSGSPDDRPDDHPGWPDRTGEDDPAEAVVGTLTLRRGDNSTHAHPVDTRAPVRTTTDADAAVVEALTDRAGHQVVRRLGGGFEVCAFGPAVCWVTTPVASFDGDGEVRVLAVNGGDRVYVPADPEQPGARRVDVPGLRSFYGLPTADRDAQRTEWANRLAGASRMTAAQASALGVPLLRAALARHAQAAFPVTGVRRGNPPFDAGGVVNGLTLPPLEAPLREPHCYLPVIARVEGRMESINAWDAGAGISLGPIQFNVDRAALFRFLWQLRREDPELFQSALGTPLGWEMAWDVDHADLVVTRTGAVDTLHGRGSDPDRETNARYLMRGVPGPGPRDPDYRRQVAGCFRDVVAWPHVQQMIVDVSAWWLGPKLAQIQAAGIGPLDARRPDHDTFVLTALLLSAGVRFSGCLGQILTQLRRWSTVADQLAHLDEAVAATGSPCKDELPARLTQQRRHAETVFTQIRALLGLAAPTAPVTGTSRVRAGSGEAADDPGDPGEGTGWRNAWADTVLAEIGPQLAPEWTPETWWDGMVEPVWLGRRFRNGIHVVLHRKLQAAEAALRRDPRYATLSDAELGRAVGLQEEIGGARQGRGGMHSFGLAVDIEYSTSPYILGNVDASISNRSTALACDHAALLVGGRMISTAAPFLSSLGRSGTGAAYDALRTLDQELRAYLRIAGDAAGAIAYVQRNATVRGVVETGETPEAAAARWAGLAQADLDRLRLPGSNFTPRDPRAGFLGVSRDLTVALRDGGRLAWGALDFGPASGDVMHFDARRDGVGAAVLAGIRAHRQGS